jgi:DNA (cytosine-5)-methyltransferase 1
MRALDLFCKAGGASSGLAAAGFHVTGVDIAEQPRYPFRFVRGNALEVDLDGFDFVWASPPCQTHSTATRDKSSHADLIPAVREKLRAWGGPYVIENVAAARRKLHAPVMMCGQMFGLRVARHRFFECSFPVLVPPHPGHRGSIVTGEIVSPVGHGGRPHGRSNSEKRVACRATCQATASSRTGRWPWAG